MAVRTATYVGGRVFPFIHVAWLVSHPAQLSPNVTIVTIPNKVAACKLSLASPLWVCVCTQCVGLFHKRALASASVHSTVGWSACALLLFATFSEPHPIHLTQQPSHLQKRLRLGGTSTYMTIIYVYQTSIGLIDYFNEKLGLAGSRLVFLHLEGGCTESRVVKYCTIVMFWNWGDLCNSVQCTVHMWWCEVFRKATCVPTYVRSSDMTIIVPTYLQNV